jgi:hypothetical protein
MSIRTTTGSISGLRWKFALDITCILLALPIWLSVMILLMLAPISDGSAISGRHRALFGLLNKVFACLENAQQDAQLPGLFSLVYWLQLWSIRGTIHLENDGCVEDRRPLQPLGRTREMNSDCGKQGARTAGIQGAQRIGTFPMLK